MSDEEREIILKGTKIVAGGRSIKLTNIVVRRGVPLPALGERVVGIDEQRIVKFAGNVIRVDEERRVYDVELRKSFLKLAEAPVPSLPLTSRGAQTAREVAERQPSVPIKKSCKGSRLA